MAFQWLKFAFSLIRKVEHLFMSKCHLYFLSVQFSSVQSLNRVWPLWPHESQHARPPCPWPTPGVYADSHPSSQWCHPAISSSVVPFFSSPQSFPASESFPMSQVLAWGGQSTGVSALASFLPKKSQGWSSEWTGWISLQSKGLSRVFSNTTVQKHQFFGAFTWEGNGNPHQYSCLENPRDGEAWWATVYGVAQSQTRLKQLSSSSSRLYSSPSPILRFVFFTLIHKSFLYSRN